MEMRSGQKHTVPKSLFYIILNPFSLISPLAININNIISDLGNISIPLKRETNCKGIGGYTQLEIALRNLCAAPFSPEARKI